MVCIYMFTVILVRIMLFCEYSEDNPTPHGRSSSFPTTYSPTEDTEVRAFGASSFCLSVCLSHFQSACLSISQSVRSPISQLQVTTCTCFFLAIDLGKEQTFVRAGQPHTN